MDPVNPDWGISKYEPETCMSTIKYYATCGKENGWQYPGRIKRYVIHGGAKKLFWVENKKATRTRVDALYRPYAVTKPIESPGLEYEKAQANPFHVPDRFSKITQGEKGWNLPLHHNRHFFKFPYEVVERILKHCLVVDGPVMPDCIYENEFSAKKLPTYKACSEYTLWRVRKCRRRDVETGQWCHQKVMIYKRSIDATILRVCKRFRDQGAALLYGANTFFLDRTMSCEIIEAGLHILRDGKFCHKDKNMPYLSRLQDNDIQDDIGSLMETNDDGPNWIFTDPFLRFLKTIGPQNAALIKNLKFDGIAFLPNPIPSNGIPFYQGWDDVGRGIFNLLYYLQLYPTFIERYSPNLQTLDIGIRRYTCTHDVRWNEDAETDYSGDDSEDESGLDRVKLRKMLIDAETAPRQAIRDVLNNEIPKLKSLKKFKAHSYYNLFAPCAGHLQPSRAVRKAYGEWVTAEDKKMSAVSKIVEQAAKERDKGKHSDIVKTNTLLGVSDMKETATLNCL